MRETTESQSRARDGLRPDEPVALPVEGSDPDRAPGHGRLAVVIAVLVLVGSLAWTWVAVGAHDAPAVGTTHTAMTVRGGALDLTSVDESVAVHYRFAREHRAELAQLRCWCGCEQFLDHRHLADCFVRPDGGWEPHAAGCGVCLGEAALVAELLADGRSLTDISSTIEERFGPTVITTPPRP